MSYGVLRQRLAIGLVSRPEVPDAIGITLWQGLEGPAKFYVEAALPGQKYTG